MSYFFGPDFARFSFYYKWQQRRTGKITHVTIDALRHGREGYFMEIIDLAVASHPQSDHVGSMTRVLRNCRVETFVNNGVEYDSAMYRELAGEVSAQLRQKRLRYFSH